MKNHYTNTRIEFHILQSFGPTCLNRDDVGSPKTAMVGGSLRARVSSQCWKRYVRLQMNELGIVAGTRTKWLSKLIKEACIAEGASEEQANCCANKIHSIFYKEKENAKTKSKKDAEPEAEDESSESKQNSTLIFLSPNEISKIAKAFKEAGFSADEVIPKDQKKQVSALVEIINRKIDSKIRPMDAFDIALFGRMVADAAHLNVEAAASFSHAISTHKVSNEVEFFTALDDLESKTPGASHLGSLEFNSATYYRYVSLDLGQLCESIGESEMPRAVEAFTKALFLAVPGARQNTMSGASQWDFAKVFVRKGQRLQISFETSIKSKEGGFSQSSIDELKNQLAVKEKRAGSLFGKIAEYTFGDSEFSIDDLTSALRKHVEGAI